MVETKEAVKSPPGGVCKQTDESHGHGVPTVTAARSEITGSLSDHASSLHPEGGGGGGRGGGDHDGAMHDGGRQKPPWIGRIEMMESESNKVNWDNRLKKIHKVPLTLRQVESNKKCYDPVSVAIGPYHRNQPGQQPALQQMEILKIQFAKQYSDECGKGVWELYQTVEKQLVDAKKWYEEDSVKNIDDESFAKMMFLDACFVIQIISQAGKTVVKPLVTSLDMAFVVQDIFLLENQLPWAILTAVMNLRFTDREKMNKVIDKFIDMVIKSIMPAEPNEINKEKEDENYMPMHLLHLVQRKLIDDNQIKGDKSYPLSDWYSSYRSLKELKSVGIHVSPSYSCRLSDITFERGRLRIPQICINGSTKSILLNLVAYEASINIYDGVTSFIEFMDLMIDHAEDVKELRSSGVILNSLVSDEVVAKLFNEITDKVLLSGESFVNVKKSIERYYKSRPRLWLAECLHNYFRSPWSIIAFLAATVVLLLTLAQTIFSALQIWKLH